MADTTTVMALPFPEGSDANDVPADMQALAERLDDAPGIESLTSAQIAALSAGQKPAGRVVYNSTTSKLQVSNGSTFANIDAAALLLAGGTMAGNIAMGSNKVTGLAKGTATGDAVARQQIQSGYTGVAAVGYVDIAFSPAFGSAPIVVATATADTGANTPPYVTNVTAGGARINGLGLGWGANWIAVGN